MVAGGTWLTVIASDAASIGERVLRAVGGGFLGVIVGLSFIFLSYLVYVHHIQNSVTQWQGLLKLRVNQTPMWN